MVPTKSRLQSLNREVTRIFPDDFLYYRSAESVVCDSVEAQNAAELRYFVELLNSIEVGASLPDHEIDLKKVFIVMLLRNIKPSSGLVNGIKYVVENMSSNVLLPRSVSGSKTGERFTLPRMKCTGSKNDFPIAGFRRCRFLVRICIDMIIDKAEVKSVPGSLRIDLHGQCFSHSQIHVAISKKKNPRNVFILTTDGSNRTKNDVFS